MRFPPSFLDEIRARVTLSAIVGRRVAWDRRKTNAGKGDYWACCPFHAEKSPSFHVEDRKGRYYCFGCKASGDAITFLTEKEGVSFPEAVERLAREAGLALPRSSPEDDERERRRATLHDVMEMAAVFFEAELQSGRGARARGYLADRGLLADVQREFRLGFAPDSRSALRKALAGKNVTVEQMVEAGLLISGEDIPVAYDRFRDRVMFPIRDPRGRVVAFGGRALSKDAPAKYLNSPETPLFHKGAILYNLDKARAAAHEAGSIVAVEGYMDTIAMYRAGIPQTVAPLGTALTADQLTILWRMAPEPVLCFDGDAAGQKAASRALDLSLPLIEPGRSLRFAFLPEGLDPDDLLKSEGAQALKDVIAGADPLSEVLWRRALSGNDRSTPERRAQFEHEIAGLVRSIGDETVRAHYGADVRERLQRLWGRDLPPAGRRRALPGFRPPRRGDWPKPWEIPSPASPALKALARSTPAKTSERRERLILLGIVNYPELLDDFLETLSHLEFSSRELDGFRRHILDAAAAGEGLDSASLRRHLSEHGFGPALDRLEAQAERLSEWFLVSGAASEDARTGLSQMFALHRKSVTLERELKTAEAALASDPTEENLGWLNAVRAEMSAHAGAEAAVEGFGSASGREREEL